MSTQTAPRTNLLAFIKQALIVSSAAEFQAVVHNASQATGISTPKVLADFVALKAAKSLADDPAQVIKKLGKRSNQTIWQKDLPQLYQRTQQGLDQLHPQVRAVVESEGLLGAADEPVAVPTTAMVKRTRVSR